MKGERMSTTTFVCPNCGTTASVSGQPIQCELCHDTQHALYVLHAGGKTLMLCLACIQKQVWCANPPALTYGPSEVKSA